MLHNFTVNLKLNAFQKRWSANFWAPKFNYVRCFVGGIKVIASNISLKSRINVSSPMSLLKRELSGALLLSRPIAGQISKARRILVISSIPDRPFYSFSATISVFLYVSEPLTGRFQGTEKGKVFGQDLPLHGAVDLLLHRKFLFFLFFYKHNNTVTPPAASVHTDRTLPDFQSLQISRSTFVNSIHFLRL